MEGTHIIEAGDEDSIATDRTNTSWRFNAGLKTFSMTLITATTVVAPARTQLPPPSSLARIIQINYVIDRHTHHHVHTGIHIIFILASHIAYRISTHTRHFHQQSRTSQRYLHFLNNITAAPSTLRIHHSESNYSQTLPYPIIFSILFPPSVTHSRPLLSITNYAVFIILQSPVSPIVPLLASLSQPQHIIARHLASRT